MTGHSPPLLAISIRQPWAWLIVKGYKPYENREWKPGYPARQHVEYATATQKSFRVSIHAATTINQWDYRAAVEAVQRVNKKRELAGLPLITLPHMGELARGGIIGTATVMQWHDKPPAMDFAFGSGFTLTDVQETPFTPCAGRLGFFTPQFPV